MAKILLIEDEAPVREMLLDELSVQGHKVIEAKNGEEGLKKIFESPPDIVLCDRAMSGMSGYEVLAQLRSAPAQFNNIHFVFLTALTDPRDRAAVDHLAPSAYIDKPVDFLMLTKKIESLLKPKH